MLNAAPSSDPGRVAQPDVEVQLRAEREVHAEAEVRQQLLVLMRNSPACMASLAGPDHMITVANKLFRELFGGRSLAGLPLRVALPELQEQRFFALLDEAYCTGKTCYGYEEVTYLDAASPGRRGRVYFSFIGQASLDATGAVKGLLLSAYDVSTHVQARQQAEARGPQPLCTSHQLGLANEELSITVEQLTVSVEELVAANEELDATNDQLSVSNQQLALANEKLSVSNAEIQAQARELRRTQKSLQQLNRELEARVAERTAQLQTSLRETEQANAALSQGNDQLAFINQDLDSFVHAASHDLKLPVINLAGLFEELRRAATFADPAEEALLVPLVEQALRQLRASLDDLAALGQAQQMAQAQAEPVALEALVGDVLHALEPQVRAARARITTDFAVRPTLTYPRASLHTVLLNLLSNAFKYADPARPGRVHLSLWLDGGQPVLRVQDNGLGFDAARHGAELFQLFRRFHAHVEGTGVGLYLVNRLLRAHGGRLEVDSEVGAGATFRVYLGRAL